VRALFVAISLIFAGIPVAAATPKFEVATVKPSNPNGHDTDLRIYPGGRILITGLPLKTMVAMALDVSWWQIPGGDSWMENDFYDVEAKPPANIQPAVTNLRHSRWAIEDKRLCSMLLALLIDRFQFKFHPETRTGTVYVLEKSGKPIRLQPEKSVAVTLTTNPDLSEIDFSGGRFFIFATTMPQLAKFAATWVLHAPVRDQTELSGSFDYRQPTPLTDSEVSNADLSASFAPLLSELGLKLEKTKGPVETIVIDHAEKPSPN
jgi:uncharacterized protein (TIGR03435 family)